MAAWSQVSQLILNSKQHRSGEVSPSLVKVEIETAEGRTQIVFVGQVDDKVIFSSLVCKLASVNLDSLFATDALQNLPYGVSAVGEYLSIKHSQSLEKIDAQEIAEPIVALGFMADVFEKAITGKDAL
jgi:hypothetical protein